MMRDLFEQSCVAHRATVCEMVHSLDDFVYIHVFFVSAEVRSVRNGQINTSGSTPY
jgi:hypothetical protein